MAMLYRHISQGVWLAAWMSAAASSAFAGANPNFTLPLHAKVSSFEQCNGYLPVDCLGVRPVVEVETGQPITVFLMVANYAELLGIQTAFEVDPSWTFTFGLWDCQYAPNENPPQPPFGPTSGTITAVFNCVTSGELLPIGRMTFVSGTGCVGQVESAYPSGTWALDCQQQFDRILPNEPGQAARLGKVCVGTGGQDACDRVTPVAAATWGRIKATYH